MSIEELAKQFIRPNSEIEELRKARTRKSTAFPTMDGYYWLQWPEHENRPDPATGKPHMEICQFESGVVLLIGTRENYVPVMKNREFKFFGPLRFQGQEINP